MKVVKLSENITHIGPKTFKRASTIGFMKHAQLRWCLGFCSKCAFNFLCRRKVGFPYPSNKIN